MGNDNLARAEYERREREKRRKRDIDTSANFLETAVDNLTEAITSGADAGADAIRAYLGELQGAASDLIRKIRGL